MGQGRWRSAARSDGHRTTAGNHSATQHCGDYIDRDQRWPKIRATGIAFADAMKAAGGSVDVVDLPKAGVHGNSHMMMMDKNNIEVATLIQNWLEGKGLTKKP